MRRTRAFLAAMLLVGLAAMLDAAMPIRAAHGVPSAAGDVTVSPRVIQSNWFWHKQADGATGTDLQDKIPEPSGVRPGDLAVAYTPGGANGDATAPSKETYLAFDVSGISPDAVLTSFTFTMPLDGAAQLTTTPPSLTACLPTRGWANGQGDPYSQKPVDDCTSTIAAKGQYDATTAAYTFAVPAIAQQRISDINYGVA